MKPVVSRLLGACALALALAACGPVAVPPDDTCPETCGSLSSCDAATLSCVCDEGFAPQDGLCTDVDECAENPDVCGAGTCVNTTGGYNCECPAGMQMEDGTCQQAADCSLDPSICGNGTCEDVGGTHACTCEEGFVFEDGNCRDLDECSADPDRCGEGTCENTEGGFTCGCADGLTFEDGACVASADSCADRPCFPGAACTDAPAPETGFTCGVCPDGYTGDGVVCTDVDECADGTDTCGAEACTNLAGSHACGTWTAMPALDAPQTYDNFVFRDVREGTLSTLFVRFNQSGANGLYARELGPTDTGWQDTSQTPRLVATNTSDTLHAGMDRFGRLGHILDNFEAWSHQAHVLEDGTWTQLGALPDLGLTGSSNTLHFDAEGTPHVLNERKWWNGSAYLSRDLFLYRFEGDTWHPVGEDGKVVASQKDFEHVVATMDRDGVLHVAVTSANDPELAYYRVDGSGLATREHVATLGENPDMRSEWWLDIAVDRAGVPYVVSNDGAKIIRVRRRGADGAWSQLGDVVTTKSKAGSPIDIELTPEGIPLVGTEVGPSFGESSQVYAWNGSTWLLAAGQSGSGFRRLHVAPDGQTFVIRSDYWSHGISRLNAPLVALSAPTDRVAFFTSTTYDGALGGVERADAICDMHALRGGLPGRYTAALSTTGAAASTRMSGAEQVINTRHRPVAADVTSLLTEGPTARLFDEQGYPHDGVTPEGQAWTGTLATGAASGVDCEGWTHAGSGSQGSVGGVTLTGSALLQLDATLEDSSVTCASRRSLLCIQK